MEEEGFVPLPPARKTKSSGVDTLLWKRRGNTQVVQSPEDRPESPFKGPFAETPSRDARSGREGRRRARPRALTFAAGLHQAVPLPTAVTQQGEGAVAVARDVAWGAHVQQLVPHLQAGASLQDGVREGGWVSTRLL